MVLGFLAGPNNIRDARQDNGYFVKWYKHNADGSLEPVNNFRMAQGNESFEESRNIMLGWNSQDFSLQADVIP
jgi:hypothetical protein